MAKKKVDIADLVIQVGGIGVGIATGMLVKNTLVGVLPTPTTDMQKIVQNVGVWGATAATQMIVSEAVIQNGQEIRQSLQLAGGAIKQLQAES